MTGAAECRGIEFGPAHKPARMEYDLTVSYLETGEDERKLEDTF